MKSANHKNVLLIVQNASYPFDKRVSKEASSLHQAGYNVFVISPTSVYDKEKRKNIDGVKYIDIKITCQMVLSSDFFWNIFYP